MRRMTLSLKEFAGLARTLLIDFEFTCWEDSQRTGWADTGRPAELIEVALVDYLIDRDEVKGVFTAFIRPRLNPRLSLYCRELVGISQETIDRAEPLAEVLGQLREWLTRADRLTVPTSGWGNRDRVFLSADAERVGLPLPLHPVPHADLENFYRQQLGIGDRDAVRVRIGLEPNPARHRALADALDLRGFTKSLRKTYSR